MTALGLLTRCWCGTMGLMRMAILVCGLAVALTACDTGGGGVPNSPAPGVNSPAPGVKQWVMPNLVGAKLQDAQDQIQKVTGNPAFITRSHDATGQGRNQVLDSNWKVCSQNVAAGAMFDGNAKIDFGAVKLSEQCP